jgi:5-methyltetrahydrofolate--homocysteine methyltransferase
MSGIVEFGRRRGIRRAPIILKSVCSLIWLQAEKHAGIRLTENFAMLPASSVCGIYISHPEAKYFSVGKIDRDQVRDYQQRKGMDLAEVERWLRPNLAYEP